MRHGPAAFHNAMALDITMGGSTNTVLHTLAIAHEAEVPFTMKDIDRLSRVVPNVCKVAPSSQYHVEDVHRAGGILTILGELDRARVTLGLQYVGEIVQRDDVIGILLEDIVNRHEDRRPMMVGEVPLNASGNPSADHTDQGWFDDALAVEDLVAVRFIRGKEEPAADLRQDC